MRCIIQLSHTDKDKCSLWHFGPPAAGRMYLKTGLTVFTLHPFNHNLPYSFEPEAAKKMYLVKQF